MGVRIIREGNGFRRWWYGEYVEDGQRRRIMLSERVVGRPPGDGRGKGDAEFEASRELARREFEAFERERHHKGNAEHLMETLIESKTGTKVEYARIDGLEGLWNGLVRTRELCGQKKRQNARVFREFSDSCGREFLFQVTPSDVKGYFDGIRRRFAWDTVKSRMSLLSGAFSRFLPHGCPNPFKTILKRNTSEDAATIHRAPLTHAQIGRAVGHKQFSTTMIFYNSQDRESSRIYHATSSAP